VKQLLLSLQFLTIIPVRVSGDVTDRDMSGAAVFFPVVGALQGLLAAGAAYTGLRAFSPDIAAGLVLLVLIVSYGGLHMDGLADTFDALAVKSSGDPEKDRQRRLEIMRDSTTGAIGAVAVVLAILLQYLFISHMLNRLPARISIPMLLLMPVLSKWSMVMLLRFGRPARRDGLGWRLMDSMDTVRALTSTLLTVILLVLTGAVLLNGVRGVAIAALFSSLVLVLYIFCRLAVRFLSGRFGGLTGDNCGAVHEISQIIYLFWISLWLPRYI
jgi:adenosylcobinamide-GDP ribazoletransferase